MSDEQLSQFLQATDDLMVRLGIPKKTVQSWIADYSDSSTDDTRRTLFHDDRQPRVRANSVSDAELLAQMLAQRTPIPPPVPSVPGSAMPRPDLSMPPPAAPAARRPEHVVISTPGPSSSDASMPGVSGPSSGNPAPRQRARTSDA